MHPLETQLIAIIQAGDEPSIAALGGIEELASAAEVLGASPLMPELLVPMLDFWQKAPPADSASLKTILVNLLETATTDFVWMEVVDVLDAYRPLPDQADEVCFNTFLAKAGRPLDEMTGLARGAVLDGAFRWATSNRRWQLRLLDFLLGLSIDDDPEFLVRAAKIAGVAYSHWRERDLIPILTQLADLEAANAEATFELGMANLANALDSPHRQEALLSFNAARGWFERSALSSDSRPEAFLYQECLELLTGYHSGVDSRFLSKVSDRICSHAFELKAWHVNNASPSWLGTRRMEAAFWNILAARVAGLTGYLDEASWWEPGVVVEQYIFAIYNASRSILRHSRDGSLTVLLRPRIESTIAAREGQAYQLKIWLQHNMNHEWADQARELIEQVDQLLWAERLPGNPTEAAAVWPPVAAMIAGSGLPSETKTRLLAAVLNTVSLHLGNLSRAETEVVSACFKSVEDHPDYQHNPHGSILFDAALLWTVRFLFNRLEISKKDDPSVGYLFERTDGSLPHEDELQLDFFRWLSTNAAGSELEPTNQGGGRADLRMKSSGERLIFEVKRELHDSSFNSLEASYAAQTTDYQNVSIRLGILLVLDLATPNREGTPHLTSLVKPHTLQREGESQPRHIIIVKIPGRRKLPSELTKIAKSKPKPH